MKPEYLLLSFTVCEFCNQWYAAKALDLGEFMQFEDEGDDLPTFPRFQETLFKKYGLGKLYTLLIERIRNPQPPIRISEIMSKLEFLKNRIEVLVNVTSYMEPDDKLSVLPSLSVLLHILRPEFKKISFKTKILKNKRKFRKENVHKVTSLCAKIEEVLSKLESDVELSKKIAFDDVDRR